MRSLKATPHCNHLVLPHLSFLKSHFRPGFWDSSGRTKNSKRLSKRTEEEMEEEISISFCAQECSSCLRHSSKHINAFVCSVFFNPYRGVSIHNSTCISLCVCVCIYINFSAKVLSAVPPTCEHSGAQRHLPTNQTFARALQVTSRPLGSKTSSKVICATTVQKSIFRLLYPFMWRRQT